MGFNFRKPLWLVKWTNYEYWPLPFLYAPTLFHLIYLALKSRSLTFFSLVNPVEEFGGFFGAEKNKVLDKIQSKYLPTTFSISVGDSLNVVENQLFVHNIDYPFIVKPNSGERGVNVELMSTREDLVAYLKVIDRDCVIQEFIQAPIELGVFYYRLPDKSKSEITGIVDKKLLTMVGDGKSTILQLMEESDRARFQIKRISEKDPEVGNKILEKGEAYILEPIGNHNRGTMFVDGSDIISERLVQVFDDIASTIPGFYYGRLDVKIDSLEQMNNGNGIKVLEINGVYAEPAHIYDPKHNLFFAYKEIFRHYKIAYNIALQNKKRGFKSISFRLFRKMLRENYLEVKKLT